MHLRITDLRPYILVYATSAAAHHYQKTGNSWRPKTVRKAWNTVRNTIPDDSPSGIRRQESIVRKSEVLLSANRQESFPVGSSWRPSWGCLEDQFLMVKTVRKSDKRAKKIYTCMQTYIRDYNFTVPANPIYMIVSYTCPLKFIHTDVGIHQVIS